MRSAGSEKISISGPAGKLEGLWLPSGDTAASRAVVLCHPHPLYGGSMETRLVARAAKKLAQTGLQTLRFNFRGVRQSEGRWDEGRGEMADLEAAIGYVQARTPGAVIGLFGFSFGASIVLNVGCRHPAIRAMVAVAPAVKIFPPAPMEHCNAPKLVIYGGKDEVADPDALRAWIETVDEPRELLYFPDAGHFFEDDLDALTAGAAAFLARTL